MADSARVALAAHIVVVAAAARVVGFAAAHIAADIAVPAAGLVGIAAASHIVAHIVEAFAVDNMARQARFVARGIAPAAHIVVAGSFARGMDSAASARPAGRAAARARNFAALDIAVVAHIVADFGIVGIAAVALVADSFGMFAARNFAQASL